MPLFKRKKLPDIPYDPKTQKPAVRSSICTGELTAGFVDRATGKFTELMRVDSIEEFKRRTGADEIEIRY